MDSGMIEKEQSKREEKADVPEMLPFRCSWVSLLLSKIVEGIETVPEYQDCRVWHSH